jgi:hypothetical protein
MDGISPGACDPHGKRMLLEANRALRVKLGVLHTIREKSLPMTLWICHGLNTFSQDQIPTEAAE